MVYIHVFCLVVVDKTYAGGVAEDTDVDIQPITRADFVPAKVFRSRSMNTPPGLSGSTIDASRLRTAVTLMFRILFFCVMVSK